MPACLICGPGRRSGSSPEERGRPWSGCACQSRAPLRAGNSEVLREAALAGLGLALLPDFSARDALRQGQLEPVLPAWRPVDFFGDAIYAIHPWSGHTAQPVRLLVEHLRQRLLPGFE